MPYDTPTNRSQFPAAQLQAWPQIFVARLVCQWLDLAISWPGRFLYAQILAGLRFAAVHPRKIVSPCCAHVLHGSPPSDSCVGEAV